MSLAHGILGFLNYGGHTGYDIAKEFEMSMDYFWHATISQVYRELASLEQKEYVTSEIYEQSDKPNKKIYRITESGRHEFLRWMAEDMERMPYVIRSNFVMKLFFSGERPIEETIAMVEEFLRQCEEMKANSSGWKEHIGEYGKYIKNIDKVMYWLLAGSYGKEYVDTSIKWAKRTLRILKIRQTAGKWIDF